MLDIEFRIRTNKIGDAYLFTCIETDVVLLRPQLIFQNLFIGRRNIFTCLFFIELLDFCGILRTVFLSVFVPFSNRPTLVGIVQFAGILYVHFRVLVNYLLTQQPIYHFAQFVERAHRHRVANRICFWRTQLIYPLLVLLGILVGLYHGRMIEGVCCSGLKVKIVAQVVFDTEVQCTLHHLVRGIEIDDKLKHLALNGFSMLHPNVMAYNVWNLCHHDGM